MLHRTASQRLPLMATTLLAALDQAPEPAIRTALMNRLRDALEAEGPEFTLQFQARLLPMLFEQAHLHPDTAQVLYRSFSWGHPDHPMAQVYGSRLGELVARIDDHQCDTLAAALCARLIALGEISLGASCRSLATALEEASQARDPLIARLVLHLADTEHFQPNLARALHRRAGLYHPDHWVHQILPEEASRMRERLQSALEAAGDPAASWWECG